MSGRKFISTLTKPSPSHASHLPPLTLKEYLAEFADGTQVSVIIANPKKRKVYIPEEIFMIKDEKIGKPVLCIQIAEEREMEEDEIKAAEEDEKREK